MNEIIIRINILKLPRSEIWLLEVFPTAVQTSYPEGKSRKNQIGLKVEEENLGKTNKFNHFRKYLISNMPPMLFDTNALHVMPHRDGPPQSFNANQ